MALKGSFETNHISSSAVNETYLKFEWSCTQDTTNNRSTISWTLKAYRPTTSNWVNGYNIKCAVNGTSYSIGSIQLENNKTLKSGSFTINHSNDGTASFSASCSGNVYSSSGNSVSGSSSWNLDTIPRYFSGNSTLTLVSRTETTATMKWTTTEKCSTVQYRLNSGSWVNAVNDANATSGTYTITGLSSNTTYKIEGDYKRRDSGLWSKNKPSISTTTYNYPYCSSSPNLTIGNNLNLAFYNPLGRSCTVKITGKDNSTIYTKSGFTGTSLTGFNTDDIVDKWYKSLGTTSSGIYKVNVVYGSSSKTTSGATYTLTGNVLSAREKVNGTWKRGKIWIKVNGTWKRGIIWNKVNGIWKKGA